MIGIRLAKQVDSKEDYSEEQMKNLTLDYYNENAYIYANDTRYASMTGAYAHFFKYVPKGGRILDFGCGSGRDTKYFRDHGFKVDAVDGSEEMCRLAAEYAGVPVKQMLFQELSAQNAYDGIWACASILHLTKDELSVVFCKMMRALKRDGVIYTSFKYGEAEEERNGRYFTDFTEQTFQKFMTDRMGLTLTEWWLSEDVRNNREDERWLNLILQKPDTI